MLARATSGRVVKGINVGKRQTAVDEREAAPLRYSLYRRSGRRDQTTFCWSWASQCTRSIKTVSTAASLCAWRKRAKTLVLLDGSEAKLNADTLVIADHSKALAMGGYLRWRASGVNDETQNVLREWRVLQPALHHRSRTPSRLAYRCLSRYERGVDRLCSTKRWNVRPAC